MNTRNTFFILFESNTPRLASFIKLHRDTTLLAAWRFIKLIILIFSFISLAGCLKANYPVRDYYLLQIDAPKEQKQKTETEVLQINAPTVVPPFASLSFIYRTNSLNYMTDFYHAFLVPPSQQIQQWSAKYIQNLGLFKRVLLIQLDRTQSHYILSSSIQELYADYRNRETPCGVMAIQFTLVFISNGQRPKVLMTHTFRQAIPLKEKSSTALVYAWNTALQNILAELAHTITPLIKTEEKRNPPPPVVDASIFT